MKPKVCKDGVCCPYCGSTNELYLIEYDEPCRSRIECENCGTCGPWGILDDDVLEAFETMCNAKGKDGVNDIRKLRGIELSYAIENKLNEEIVENDQEFIYEPWWWHKDPSCALSLEFAPNIQITSVEQKDDLTMVIHKDCVVIDSIRVRWYEFETIGEAYATAWCIAWLLAREIAE